MTQALNYTTKAIEQFAADWTDPATMPLSALGIRYLEAKMRAAQAFILPDGGNLMDRAKPHPELPAHLFRPPFPVVALEYQTGPSKWGNDFYDGSQASRRISLAWDWQDDLPPLLKLAQHERLGPGVAIASIAWYDEHQKWVPIGAVAHLAYDAAWVKPTLTAEEDCFRQSLLASGRLNQKTLDAPSLATTMAVVMPEAVIAITRAVGMERARAALSADLMDEVNAYLDLCVALACRNVRTESHDAPAALNKQRVRNGRLPLKGFHVLNLAGGGDMPGPGRSGGERGQVRSHLRRGHVRRLAPDRMTWVNQTIVRGHGFVEKAYAL